jgi:DNA-binding transcriptional MerR regulator
MLKGHKTIGDAANELGVSPKTIRDWIEKDFIPEPPVVEYGIRTIQYFTDEYLEKAKEEIKRRREIKNSKKKKTKKEVMP